MTATKKEPASLRFLTPEDEAFATGKKPAADAAPLSSKPEPSAAPSSSVRVWSGRGWEANPAAHPLPKKTEDAICENVNRIEEAGQALEAVLDALEMPQPDCLRGGLQVAARLLVRLCVSSARAISGEALPDVLEFIEKPQERGV